MSKLVLVLTLVLSSAALAESKYFGEAGCGWGSQIQGKKGNQILAATTNGTSGTQTFGISFGTSNCTDEGGVKARKKVSAFIEANKFELARDAARGEGETLSSLGYLIECSDVGNSLKQNYNKVFIDTQMDAASIEKEVLSIRSQACGA